MDSTDNKEQESFYTQPLGGALPSLKMGEEWREGGRKREREGLALPIMK